MHTQGAFPGTGGCSPGTVPGGGQTGLGLGEVGCGEVAGALGGGGRARGREHLEGEGCPLWGPWERKVGTTSVCLFGTWEPSRTPAHTTSSGAPEPHGAGGRAAWPVSGEVWRVSGCSLPCLSMRSWTLVPKKWKIHPLPRCVWPCSQQLDLDGGDLEKPSACPRRVNGYAGLCHTRSQSTC